MTPRKTKIDTLTNALPDAILLVDPAARIVDANRACVKTFGRSVDDLRGAQLTELVSTDEALVRKYLALCAASPSGIPGRLSVDSAGRQVNYRCAGGALEAAHAGSPATVYLRFLPSGGDGDQFRQLTDQIDTLGREVEQRLRAEQVLDGQRFVLELIAEEAPLEEVLSALTDLIETHSRGGARASILLLDADRKHLRHGAAPSLPDSYTAAIDGLEIGPQVGSCGTAAYDNRVVITQSIALDPKWEGFRELAHEANLHACTSIPITGRNQAVLGTFALYYDRPREPHKYDLSLVSLLARTTAIALERAAAAREIRQLLRRERSARADAEEANRAKDEFLAMVSHELRNPLNAIVGWTSVLASENLDEDTIATGLDAIQRNSNLQARLIDEILDYSRIRAGKLSLELAPTDLAELTRSTVESARPHAAAEEVSLTCKIDLPDGVRINADTRRIQQVLNNLLSNAIKFTPGGGQVTVTLGERGSDIVLAVADTGCGIEAQFLPHVFERFRQEDGSNQRRYEGLGIGLAIVKSVVELHRGSIHAFSAGRGKGARFEVTLPRTTSGQHLATEKSVGRPDLKGLRILAADDAIDARTLMNTLFTTAGAEVTLAANGREALDALEKERPDIFLCDIGMPGMDGDEVIRRFRAAEEEGGHARLPAVAITAYARGVDRDRALQAGFDAHMAKPIDPQQLLWLVADYGRAQAASDSADT